MLRQQGLATDIHLSSLTEEIDLVVKERPVQGKERVDPGDS
jgi:hypothetical protein